MKRIVLVIAAAVAASLFALCALSGCMINSGKANFLNGEASYDGSTLTVTLPGNETTGYAWSYLIEGENIECTVDLYKADEADNETEGAGGTQTYRFKTTGPCEGTTIKFAYARSWESSTGDLAGHIDIYTNSAGDITSFACSDD